jgi:uncharacterized protein (DUF885 family)
MLRAGLAPIFAALAALTLASSARAQSSLTESERLNEFFEQVFQRNLARSPMAESRLGIKTHQDRWDDVSDKRRIEDAKLLREDLEALHRFKRESLTPDALLSYRLFERQAQQSLRAFEWRRNDYLVTQMGGLHRSVATILLNSHPIASRKDAEAYIARLAAVKPLMAQLVRELQRQERAGVQPPRFVYDLTIGECENLVRGKPFDASSARSPMLADFETKLAQLDLAESNKVALIARAEAALRIGFGPGYRHLIAHLHEAQKAASDDAGIWKIPGGESYYRFALESYTTLPVSPDELHELGLREVTRIQSEMLDVMAKAGFHDSLPQIFERMRTDPAQFYPDSPEGRAQYLQDAQQLLAQVQSRQSEVLGLIPKMPVEVRPVEAWREKSAAKAFYSSPPQDGSRPGIFYVNLYDMRAAPKYQLAVILYHEAVPGHHVETVVAYELSELPKFRKFAGFAAFSEGWGLYSELLAKEMGLYADPYQDFGRLSLALMRAARLVVDTGLHQKRWTREQAVDYLDRNLPGTHYDNQREIDRYIVLPGQATSYAVGMLKILELRARARSALGARFDLKAFHDVVLGSGPMPLPVLEENVDAWIRSQRA